jgi:hypothetical protein
MSMTSLPLSFWEGARFEPFELMKFTLVYEGDLPASGNKSKPIPASRIRNELHHQMADLWDSHVVLRQLAHTARTRRYIGGFFGGGTPIYSPAVLSDYRGPVPQLEPGQTDLCAPIEVPNEVVPIGWTGIRVS